MTRVVEKAIREMASLPENDQERISRGVLSHIEKLRRLRSELEKGVKSLDAGEGRELDMEEFLRSMRKKYGAA